MSSTDLLCPCGDNDGLWCSRKDCPYPHPSDLPKSPAPVFVSAEPPSHAQGPRPAHDAPPMDWLATWVWRGCTFIESHGKVRFALGLTSQPLGEADSVVVIPCDLSIEAALELRRRIDAAIWHAKKARAN